MSKARAISAASLSNSKSVELVRFNGLSPEELGLVLEFVCKYEGEGSWYERINERLKREGERNTYLRWYGLNNSKRKKRMLEKEISELQNKYYDNYIFTMGSAITVGMGVSVGLGVVFFGPAGVVFAPFGFLGGLIGGTVYCLAVGSKNEVFEDINLIDNWLWYSERLVKEILQGHRDGHYKLTKRERNLLGRFRAGLEQKSLLPLLMRYCIAQGNKNREKVLIEKKSLNKGNKRQSLREGCIVSECVEGTSMDSLTLLKEESSEECMSGSESRALAIYPVQGIKEKELLSSEVQSLKAQLATSEEREKEYVYRIGELEKRLADQEKRAEAKSNEERGRESEKEEIGRLKVELAESERKFAESEKNTKCTIDELAQQALKLLREERAASEQKWVEREKGYEQKWVDREKAYKEEKLASEQKWVDREKAYKEERAADAAVFEKKWVEREKVYKEEKLASEQKWVDREKAYKEERAADAAVFEKKWVEREKEYQEEKILIRKECSQREKEQKEVLRTPVTEYYEEKAVYERKQEKKRMLKKGAGNEEPKLTAVGNSKKDKSKNEVNVEFCSSLQSYKSLWRMSGVDSVEEKEESGKTGSVLEKISPLGKISLGSGEHDLEEEGLSGKACVGKETIEDKVLTKSSQ